MLRDTYGHRVPMVDEFGRIASRITCSIAAGITLYHTSYHVMLQEFGFNHTGEHHFHR